MDPDEALARIRELQWRAEYYESKEDWGSALDRYREFAEAVNNLDEWLSHGGFLPAEWREEQCTGGRFSCNTT